MRVVSELMWALRRDGITISPAQAIDAVRAVEIVGWGDRRVLRAALAAVLVTRGCERAPFDASFDAFFAPDAARPGDLFARLAASGFSEAEIALLRDILFAVGERSGANADGEALRALLGHPGELDHLLRAAGVRRVLAPMTSPATEGFYAERVGRAIGLPRAANAITRIGRAFADAFGDERAQALEEALRAELAARKRQVRDHVAQEPLRKDAAGGDGTGPLGASFGSLDADEARAARRAVRLLAERLRGAESVRRRRARRGKFDPRRTARAALKTFGAPIRPVRVRRRRDRPKLLVVCDVSESVRVASRFMLELVSAMQELFASTRSFVFVSDIAETTELFRHSSPDAALAAIASGRIVSIGANSNYGRALSELERRVGREVDRRTTIVVLGDGRTNQHADGADVVRRLRDRARSLLWLCPESPSGWGLGDSRMPRFVVASSAVMVVRTARELERAARRIVAR